MTQAEAVLLAYLIVWTLVGHWYVLRRWELHRKHKARSKAALKAAATKKRNSPSNGRGNVKVKEGKVGPRRPGAVKWKPKKKPLEDKMIDTDSVWFTVDEEEAPDYNEVGQTTPDDMLQALEKWYPKVRRFDGTAQQYAQRAPDEDSVG